jgi:hypothetical protein
MTLQVGEEDFDRCQLKVIRSKVHERHLELHHPICYLLTSMVGCIVKHNHCIGPPIRLLRVEMFSQLDDKEYEGMGIVLTSIDCEVQVTHVTDCSNDV